MVCADFFAWLAACACALTPMNTIARMNVTTVMIRSTERRFFGAFDPLSFMIDLLITKNWWIVRPVQASPWTV
jgi:hypothetical protein